MNLQNFLEVCIGLMVLFFIVSLLVSSVTEYIIFKIKLRGRFLLSSIHKALEDSAVPINLADALFNHPLVARFKRNVNGKSMPPAYLSAPTFAKALTEVMIEQHNAKKAEGPETKSAPGAVIAGSFEQFKLAVEGLGPSDTQRLFKSFINYSNDIEGLQTQIEKWYNDYQDRVTGWYKATVQKYLFAVSLAVVIFFNIDTIRIAKEMNRNKTIQANIEKFANDTTAQKNLMPVAGSDGASSNNVQEILTLMNEINIPFGWDWQFSDSTLGLQKTKETTAYEKKWYLMLLGWLISAYAASRGAPFWFEVLSKTINIRKSGVKPVDAKK
jgi:hypothetical protein